MTSSNCKRSPMLADDAILNDLFHGCAFAAFIQLAVAARNWPDPEATRQLAYRLYEEALAEKNAGATSNGSRVAYRGGAP